MAAACLLMRGLIDRSAVRRSWQAEDDPVLKLIEPLFDRTQGGSFYRIRHVLIEPDGLAIGLSNFRFS